MIYEGHNGSIEIEGDELVVRREGLVARGAFGKVPPRRIPLRVVSGVAMQDASRLKNGHITLGLGGEPAASLNFTTAGSNGDTVLFTHKHREQFGQLKTWLDHVVEVNQAQGFHDVDVPAGGGQVGWFDKKAQQVEQWADANAERARQAEETRQQDKRAKGEAAGLRPDIAEAASRMGWTLGGGREIKKLQEHLHGDELVRFIAQGTYASDQGIVVLTDSRLVFLFHGLVRQAVEDFPLRSISSVQSKAGMLTGDLTVHASGNQAVIANIVKGDLKFLADALRQHLAGGAQPAATAPSAVPQPDVMDQLRKLGELRDAGVLTTEEFDAKKAELLSRL